MLRNLGVREEPLRGASTRGSRLGPRARAARALAGRASKGTTEITHLIVAQAGCDIGNSRMALAEPFHRLLLPDFGDHFAKARPFLAEPPI